MTQPPPEKKKPIHIVTTVHGKSGRFTVVRPPESPLHEWWKRFRYVILMLNLVVLLVMAQFFIVRPRQAALGTGPTAVSSSTGGHIQKGRPGPVLGAAALSLRGLKAVEPSLLPDVSALAPGSAEAQQEQAEFSRRSGLPLEVENSLGMRFRLIPPGTFRMGSPATEKGRAPLEVEHEETIYAPFYLGMCEVTQGQWLALMPKNPSYYRQTGHPVEEVTWHQCVEYALALAAREGVEEGVYRLPLEKEWEYACRAGTRTAYCFGDDPARLTHYADYAGNNGHFTNIAGKRLPNAYGIFDMHGNVWEWCLDRFRPYENAAEVSVGDPDLMLEEWRSLRGGNWHEEAAACRSANRTRLPPASHGNMLGFRLVRSIPEYRSAAGSQPIPPDWIKPAAKPAEPPPAPAPAAPPETDGKNAQP